MTIVDTRGHRCPVPSLRLRRALETASAGQVLTLIASDPMARIDVPHLLNETGDALLGVDEADGILTIRVEKRAAPTD